MAVLEHIPILEQEVVVRDFDMPFWSMMRIMVKWAFAAIPALVILGVAWILLAGIIHSALR